MSTGNPFQQPKRTKGFPLPLLLVLLAIPLSCVVALPLAMIQRSNPVAAKAALPAKRTYGIDCGKQDERGKYLASLVREGYVAKYDWLGSSYQVWARRSLLNGDFDAKQAICSAAFAWAWCENENVIRVTLIDASTGKEVGKFLPSGNEYGLPGGLRMD